MCHFITAVLPDVDQTAAIAGLFRKHGRAFRPLDNLSVQAQLQPGERYYFTTNGACDCGTGLGAAQRTGRSRRRSTVESQMEMLRKKGWNESKVARWLQQHDEQQMAQSRGGDLSGGVKSWAALIKEIVTSGRAPSVGLLLHTYAGPLSEPIKFARKEVKLEELTSEMLRGIDEDVLYEFRT